MAELKRNTAKRLDGCAVSAERAVAGLRGVPGGVIGSNPYCASERGSHGALNRAQGVLWLWPLARCLNATQSCFQYLRAEDCVRSLALRFHLPYAPSFRAYCLVVCLLSRRWEHSSRISTLSACHFTGILLTRLLHNNPFSPHRGRSNSILDSRCQRLQRKN